MKKQILTTGLALLVASSSAYAFGGVDRCENYSSQKMMSKSFMKNHGDGIHNIMAIVSNMDLTKEQWIEIKKTMLDMKKDRIDDMEDRLSITFHKDGSFDKEKFIKERSTFSKEMIESQGVMIEKIVSILDKSQKEILISKINDNSSFKRGCGKWN